MKNAQAILGVARTADPGLSGLGEGVALVRDGGLAAVLALAETVPVPAARVALTARVADRLTAFAPVSAGAAQADSVVRWLRIERAALTAALTRVAGCAEWIATLRRPKPAVVGHGGGGAGWLRARADAMRGEEAAAALAESELAPLVAALASIARATMLRRFRSRTEVGADLAILLPRGAESALRARLGAADAPLSLSGPWPAYSFCEGEP